MGYVRTARPGDACCHDGRYHQSSVFADCGTHLKERTVLNYPGRCSGVGLLLLRGTVGITVAIQAWLSVTSTNLDLLGAIPAVGLIVCGIALTVGIFTPVCSALVGVGYALVLLTPFGGSVLPQLDGATAAVGLATAAAVGLLGPGAFSIDARLLGRREIFIPANNGSESEQP
jgi:hypothetical protein